MTGKSNCFFLDNVIPCLHGGSPSCQKIYSAGRFKTKPGKFSHKLLIEYKVDFNPNNALNVEADLCVGPIKGGHEGPPLHLLIIWVKDSD
jgi:hypothetical protein